MKVAEVLSQKGSEVETMHRDMTVRSAAERLTLRQIGSVVVVDSRGTPIGVLEDRDIVRAVAEDDHAALDRPIHSVLSERFVS